MLGPFASLRCTRGSLVLDRLVSRDDLLLFESDDLRLLLELELRSLMDPLLNRRLLLLLSGWRLDNGLDLRLLRLYLQFQGGFLLRLLILSSCRDVGIVIVYVGVLYTHL